MKELNPIKQYNHGDLVQYRKSTMGRLYFGIVASATTYTVGANDNTRMPIDRYEWVANGYEQSIDRTSLMYIKCNFGQVSFRDFFKQNPEYFV